MSWLPTTSTSSTSFSMLLLISCLTLNSNRNQRQRSFNSITVADAHLWMMCPLPRQCFYESPLESNDGDGEWRRSPCPFSPGNGPHMTTVVAGETLCLRVREFVDHVGHFDINLATVPVGPGDDQALFTLNLRDHIPDLQNGTSFQQFHVDIPANVTCNPTCTIQVRQWSDDLNWYYYACSDIQVLNRTDLAIIPQLPTAGGTCQDRILEGTCEWEAGTPKLRVMILTPLLFLGGLMLWVVGVLVAVVTCCVSAKFCRPASPSEGEEMRTSGDEQDTTNPPKDVSSSNSGAREEAKEEALEGKGEGSRTSQHWIRAALRPIVLLTIITGLYMLSTGIATILLKTCNYSGAHDSELSF